MVVFRSTGAWSGEAGFGVGVQPKPASMIAVVKIGNLFWAEKSFLFIMPLPERMNRPLRGCPSPFSNLLFLFREWEDRIDKIRSSVKHNLYL
jgi:hypothetical protein